MYGDVIVRNPNGIDRDGQLMEKQAGGKQKEGDSDGERTSSSSSSLMKEAVATGDGDGVSGVWTCAVCTFDNGTGHEDCAMCGAVPSSSPLSSASALSSSSLASSSFIFTSSSSSSSSSSSNGGAVLTGPLASMFGGLGSQSPSPRSVGTPKGQVHYIDIMLSCVTSDHVIVCMLYHDVLICRHCRC